MAYKINFDDEHGDDPVSSLQALRERNLDVATIASCAPPNDKMGIRGCKWWARCPFGRAVPGRPETAFRGTGPQWVGVQRIYPTGERKDRIKACFAYVRQRERHMEQGDVWRVLAYQGDPFAWRVTEPQHIDAKGNKSGYHEVLKTDLIPRWMTPEEHPRLRKVIYASEAFQQVEDDVLAHQQAEALANLSGHDPAFWEGRGATHGLVPRDLAAAQQAAALAAARPATEGAGETDPGIRPEPSPAPPRRRPQ